MDGAAAPLVTPFTGDGDVDERTLSDLVGWLEDRGIDFLVPCGSTGEAELLTAAERTRVIETVADAASVPILAGTGSPGVRETRAATASAAEAGADAALVVTPFYYPHDQSALADYYRDLADAASIPIYLYSVPAFTDVRLDPGTAAALADHPNVAGMKDSAGDVASFVRLVRGTADADFDPLVGSGGVFAQALAAGATGGVLALSNVVPEVTVAIYDAASSDPERARQLNAAVTELNHAITAEFGIPGLKYAMRQRGAPAGCARSPHRPPDADARARLDSLIAAIPEV
ncbi:dihydrodipicolinate synthase family protein [Halobellus ruber]|uniref:Dihydrodipicolinate synthase family protein n=1 Tax=Halobellus ruber TaxID=2761102 RepID=A0A7J9SLT9_9EURY|nr:dihydrodipicolinate synthase family protein [Halobellus ruber]MBB6647059.1 dihydrodipicolinate synthase family protein [Halobellus ruber]